MSTRVHTTNPTHVKHVPGSEIEVLIRMEKNQERIFAKLGDLAAHAPVGSRVTLVAGAGNTMKPFEFGSVGAILPPTDTSLADLDETKPRSFRLLIWDPKTKQVIASNERLRARDHDEPAGRQALLPVRPASLGGEVWRLALASDNAPELLVNKDIPGIKGHLASRKDWQAFILPEAVRQCLLHVVRSAFDPEDKDAWQAKWVRFVYEMGGDYPEDLPQRDDDQLRDWANGVVAFFASNAAYAQQLTQLLGGGDND